MKTGGRVVILFRVIAPKNETQYSIHGATSGDTRNFTYRFDANQIEIVRPPYLPGEKTSKEKWNVCVRRLWGNIIEPHREDSNDS